MSYSTNSRTWISQKSKLHPAHDWIEKPAMQKLLPNLEDKSVLCLGCGSGEETIFLRSSGAKYVIGIDTSQELTEFANQNYSTNEPNCKVEFIHSKIEDVSKLGIQTKFDLVYSSLAMHYVEDWTRTFEALSQIMSSESEFVFSVHHPIKWGSQSSKSKEKNTFIMGYSKSKIDSKDYSIYGDYLTTRKVKYDLFGQIPIQFWHRSISTMWSQINSAGFEVVEFREPQPIEESQSKPDFWEVYSRIPLFAIWKIKPKNN
jgi:SAM-dependent methyltransferase